MKIEVAQDQLVEITCANAVGLITLDEWKEILYTALQSEDVVHLALDHPRFSSPPPIKAAA